MEDIIHKLLEHLDIIKYTSNVADYILFVYNYLDSYDEKCFIIQTYVWAKIDKYVVNIFFSLIMHNIQLEMYYRNVARVLYKLI